MISQLSLHIAVSLMIFAIDDCTWILLKECKIDSTRRFMASNLVQFTRTISQAAMRMSSCRGKRCITAAHKQRIRLLLIQTPRLWKLYPGFLWPSETHSKVTLQHYLICPSWKTWSTPNSLMVSYQHIPLLQRHWQAAIYLNALYILPMIIVYIWVHDSCRYTHYPNVA